MALIWCLIIPGSRGLICPGVLLFSNILSILFAVVLKPKNVEFFFYFIVIPLLFLRDQSIWEKKKKYFKNTVRPRGKK